MQVECRKSGWIVLLMVVVFGVDAARAVPLDLLDPTPRWVEVRFEVSPADQPGRLDRTWSSNRLAYLDSPEGSDAVRIRIPADEFEAHLRTTGIEAITGSFSEFVWTFEPRTGHVLKATFSGHVRERISFGPIRTSALVEISGGMTTLDRGGFREVRGVLGLKTQRYCSPGSEGSGCNAVRSARFDPASGYVNAVGMVRAATRVLEILAFSPLGEVQFSERSPKEQESQATGACEADELCSGVLDGAVPAHLGGES